MDVINTANHRSIEIDEEFIQLINFPQQCYEISDGLFDITSGVLRITMEIDFGHWKRIRNRPFLVAVKAENRYKYIA
ncbi:MAG: hypothetical protein HN826_14600 [Methylococcales bacterium]|nr:hypothetical protein [Methylococcales bacterium]